MKSAYVTAVTKLLVSGSNPEEVFRGLKRTLKARGHEQLYRPILVAVRRSLSKQGRRYVPLLTLARKTDEEKLQAEITKVAKAVKAEDAPTVRIDETIIGGFTFEYDYLRFDQSYKTKLVNLYRTIIN